MTAEALQIISDFTSEAKPGRAAVARKIAARMLAAGQRISLEDANKAIDAAAETARRKAEKLERRKRAAQQRYAEETRGMTDAELIAYEIRKQQEAG